MRALRPAAATLTAMLLASAFLVAFASRPASAADPTPSPAAPTPAPSVSATPTAEPTPVPSPVAPSASEPLPDPTSTPEPSAAPTREPSPSPSFTPDPTPAATPLLAYRLTAGQQQGTGVPAPIPLYRLVVPAAGNAAAGAIGSGSPHDAATLAGADCADCHATHAAPAPALAAQPTQNGLCYRCHGPSGPAADVQTAFIGLPANDEATDAYYTHPVSAASAAGHDPAAANEFQGVTERHAVCADCHDPHDTTSARPQQSTTGWTASGAIARATGVSVTNGAAGSAPAYALVSPRDGLTYEYELCLTCHSGWTELPARSAANPSYWALDKGIELNPANAAYHPIEAAGRNQTAQMAASLAGSSPFKAWDLTTDATIRCTSCHGDPSTVNQTASASPLTPAADAVEPPHGSPNRGLLIAPYRDRALKPVGEAYQAADFALCYLCHAERPFADPNVDPEAPDTLFPLHGAHLTALSGTDTTAGLSIDAPGDGGGYAVCAECHFRIHSTAIAYQPGDVAGVARTTGNPSLVNFAPDVLIGTSGPPAWSVPDAQGTGSCALTCHGYTHPLGKSTYTVAPGTGFSATPTSGSAGVLGLSVTFVDETRYADASSAGWLWSFGDGTQSTERNPVHTYTEAGSYTVSLTVTRTGGTALATTRTRTDYIVVSP